MNNTQQSQQEKEITLTIKTSWYNIIVAGLEEIPHKYSRQVIDSISKQMLQQTGHTQQTPIGPLQNKIIQ